MLRIIPKIERATHQIALYLSRLPGLNVSQAEAHVLVYLVSHGPSTVAQIHEEFGHRRSTLTSILDRLVSRQLITRTVSEADRRSFLVRLTPAGHRTACKLLDYLELVERDWSHRVSRNDMKGFLTVIEAACAPRSPQKRKTSSRKGVQ